MSVLAGQLVILRPHAGDQDTALIADWLSSPQVVHSSRGPRFLTLTAAREAVTQAGRSLLIVEQDDRPIGALIWRRAGATGGYSVEHVVGDPRAWADRAGFEAVSLLFNYLFRTLNAHRVELITAAFDKLMIEILVQARVMVEGVLRDYTFVDGRYHHAIVSSLLRQEYLGRVDAALATVDAVPPEDKAAARRMLAEYLDHVPTALRSRLAE